MVLIKVTTLLYSMLVTFGLPITVQFLFDTCFILQIRCFLRQYFSYVFQCAIKLHGWVPVDFLLSVVKDRERMMRKLGGWGRDDGETICEGVCANDSGVKIIVPIQRIIKGTSTVPGPAGYYGGKL